MILKLYFAGWRVHIASLCPSVVPPSLFVCDNNSHCVHTQNALEGRKCAIEAASRLRSSSTVSHFSVVQNGVALG